MSHQGSCLCGAIRLEVKGEIAPPVACHCRECRKQTGHYEVSADVQRKDLSVTGLDFITWFHSSAKVRRGFCKVCGSTLFWDPLDQERIPWTSVALGCFDLPTHTQLKEHIFVAEKGDYYEIADGLPQIADPRKKD